MFKDSLRRVVWLLVLSFTLIPIAYALEPSLKPSLAFLALIPLAFLLSKAPKKAQITIFMLLGIIVVGSFAWLFSIAKNLNKAKLETQVESAVDELLQVTSVEEYVTQCVQKVSKDGLILMGRQGAVFYDYQGSSFTGAEPVEFSLGTEIYNVSYLILDMHHPVTNGYVQPIMTVPVYPCPKGRTLSKQHKDNPCTYTYTKASTGSMTIWWNWLPLLHYVYPLYRNETVVSYNIPANAWPSETLDPPLLSVQRQLEDYIESNLEDCADFNQFAELMDYDITGGDPNVTVIFGDDDVSFEVVYPVKVLVSGGEPIVRFISFYGNQPVRFKRMYELVAQMALLESRNNPIFNMTSWFEAQAGSDNFKMWQYQTTGTDGYPTTDIYVVQDRNELHTIDGRYYTFMFARKNRPPALDYIGQDLDGPIGPLPTVGGQYYDFHVPVDAEMALKIFRVDPDDGDMNQLSLTIKGWKETWDDTFDNNSFVSQNCTFFPERCTISDPTIQPHNWTSSPIYRSTIDGPAFQYVYAKYKTTMDDLGSHLINISVDDGQWSDWQEIRVLVVDAPKAVAKGGNPYDDIPDDEASIEDPYWLDASASTSMFCEDIKFTWKDPLESIPDHPGTLIHQTILTIFQLPYGPFNIRNVTGPYKVFDVYDPTNLVHQVTLELSHSCGMNVGGDYLPTSVYQCLPHRDEAASYPFHNITYNSSIKPELSYVGLPANSSSYNADHTCCGNGTVSTYGEVLNNSNSCFTIYDYACRYAGWDTMWTVVNPGEVLEPADRLTNPPGVIITGGNLPRNANDVYIRNLTVNCDGTRGNMCDGPAEDRLVHQQGCTTCQYCVPGDPGCEDYGAGTVCDLPLYCWYASNVLGRVMCDGAGNCNQVPPPARIDDPPQVTGHAANNITGIRIDGGPFFRYINCSYYDGWKYRVRPEPGTGYTVPDTRQDRSCNGTCFPGAGNDGCTSNDWGCGAPSCVLITPNRDLDDGLRFCGGCASSGVQWLVTGENSTGHGEYTAGQANPECCGDDSSERVRNCQALAGATCDSFAPVCCTDTTDCVFAGDCFQQNTGYASTNDIYNDSEYCMAGAWRDLDSNQTQCQNHGFHWEDDDFYGYMVDEHSSLGGCCGDDVGAEGTDIFTCRSATSDTATCVAGDPDDACCTDSTFCVAVGRCFAQNLANPEINYEDITVDDNYEYCVNGEWHDPDFQQAHCQTNHWLNGECCGDDGNESLKLAYNNINAEFCCRPEYCAYDDIVGCYPPGAYNLSGQMIVCQGGYFSDPDESQLVCQTYGLWWIREGETFDIPFGGYGNNLGCEVANGTDCTLPTPGNCTINYCTECCGDDIGENNRTRKVTGTQPPINSNPGDMACCSNPNDCVYGTNCTSSGRGRNTTTAELSCELGYWYNPDNSEQHCAIFDEGNPEVDNRLTDCNSAYPTTECFVKAARTGALLPGDGEYTDNNTRECCGDDPHEYYVPLASDPSQHFCCYGPASCVVHNGVEFICTSSSSEGTVALCSDGIDNDCDGAIDCADSSCAGIRNTNLNVACCQVNADCIVSATPWGMAAGTTLNQYGLDCNMASHECRCQDYPLDNACSVPANCNPGNAYASYQVGVSNPVRTCTRPSYSFWDRYVYIWGFGSGQTFSIGATGRRYGSSTAAQCTPGLLFYRVINQGGLIYQWTDLPANVVNPPVVLSYNAPSAPGGCLAQFNATAT